MDWADVRALQIIPAPEMQEVRVEIAKALRQSAGEHEPDWADEQAKEVIAVTQGQHMLARLLRKAKAEGVRLIARDALIYTGWEIDAIQKALFARADAVEAGGI